MGPAFARFWGILLLPGVLALPTSGHGDLIWQSTYDPSDIVVSSYQDYDVLEMGDLPLIGEGAGPALPVESVVFELPAGEWVGEVEIIELEQETIPGVFRPVPADLYYTHLPPDESEPTGGGPYPASPVREGYSGTIHGTRLGSILIYPLQWIPDSGQLVLIRRIVVRVHTRASWEESAIWDSPSRPVLAEGGWRPLLLSRKGPSVSLSAAAGAKASPEFFHLSEERAEYLIVTNDEMSNSFERLADWKTARGIPARVVTLSWILSRYTVGVDEQEKIRAFLRDAYERWGTRWVLLGGDSGILPTRICRFLGDQHRQYEHGLVLCDLYYACLDGNWNGDGDDMFGERYWSPGLDLYPEIFLGRAPVNTPEEVEVFVDKVLRYRKAPALDYQKRVLFMSQQLNQGPPPGYHGAPICDTCGKWVPPDYTIKRLYQHSSYYPGSDELSLNAAFGAMNQGYGLVCQVGHGDQYKMDCATNYFRRVHADSLENLDRLSFFVLLNCSTSNIDVDCLAERLVRSERGGALAFIGNSASGFPATGKQYLQYLFKLLYQHGITTPGELIAYFRLPFAPFVTGSEYQRWTQYSYLLLGDPCVDLWVDAPRELSVSHAGAMALSDSTYPVTVESDGVPAEGVLACLWMEKTGAYARGRTDAGGSVVLPFAPGSTGTASLVVIGPGYVPVEDSVTVTGTGRVRVAAIDVDDSGEGNGNGRFEAGERVDLSVTFRNDGEGAVSGAEAALGRMPGSTVTLDVAFDGVPDTSKVWVGAGLWQPSEVPFTLGLGDEQLLGQPQLTRESQQGFVLWVDAAGWHLRCRSGADSLVVTGTLTVDGAVLAASAARTGLSLGIESEDSVEVAGSVLGFACRMDTTDFEDGVDVRVADSVGVQVVEGFAELGEIGAGAEAVGVFTVESGWSVPDGRPAWFVVDIAAGSGTWSEWIRTQVLGPRFEVLYGRVDDSGANGNGQAEPGEEIHLYPTLANWGSGELGSVGLRLRALQGATVSDSTVELDGIPAGSVRESEEAFALEVSSTEPSLEVRLVADSRTVSRDTLWIQALAPPESLWYEPGPDEVQLAWSPPVLIFPRGYRILRRAQDKAAFEFHDVAIGSSSFLDVGVGPQQSYEYAVSMFDGSGALSTPSQAIVAWANPPRQAGFPADGGGEAYGSPTAADLDRDGDLEIVVGTKDGVVVVLHHDGTVVPGWPQRTGNEIFASPALGDLDGDGDLEVVVGSTDKKMWVWNWDGTLFHPSNNPDLPPDAPGWPQGIQGQFRSAPTLSDLDGDGRLEILASCRKKDVYGWRYDGTGYLDSTAVFGVTATRVCGSPAVADLDGNGSLEVVVGTLASDWQGQVYVWESDGTDFIGTNPFAGTHGSIWTSPAIGDIDADPAYEILIASEGGVVYAWNHDGTGVLDAGGVFAKLGGAQQGIRSSPALGDIDGDGLLEVVVGSEFAYGLQDTVYAWNHDGTGALAGGAHVLGLVGEAFDLAPSSPALGDVDGDGRQEVLIGAEDGRLHAWHADGTTLEGWPVRTRLGIFAAPGIADLDGDGDVEVFIASYDARVHAWDLPGDPEDVEWGGFQSSPWHTGLYGFQPPPDTTAPRLEIAVLQNPVVERSLDLYVSSNENLADDRVVVIEFAAAEPETLATTSLAGGVRDLHLLHAGFWATESHMGEAAMLARGSDVEGNEGEAQRPFTLGKVSAAAGGLVQAADGGASLILGPGALGEDAFVVVARCPEGLVPGQMKVRRRTPTGGGPTYAIGQRGKRLAGEGIVRLRVPTREWGRGENLAVFELGAEGWVPLAPADAPPGWVGGRMERFGIFQLRFNEETEFVSKTRITGNYPNPFNPVTTIAFTLSKRAKATLTVHDVRGRLVATLLDEEWPQGTHRVLWDGRNHDGRPVASGVYFSRLVAAGESSSAKLVLLR